MQIRKQEFDDQVSVTRPTEFTPWMFERDREFEMPRAWLNAWTSQGWFFVFSFRARIDVSRDLAVAVPFTPTATHGRQPAGTAAAPSVSRSS
jgi:hypothetical protein